MKYDPAKHNRKSIRLKGYDYSQAGLYFITICVQNRESLLGEIKNGEMILNDAGKMIQTEWEKLPQRFTNIELHEFVVMPNHFHAILEIVGATLVVAPDDIAPDEINIRRRERATTRVAPTEIAPTEATQKGLDLMNKENETVAPTNKTVGDMMAAFKSITTVEYIRGVKKLNWQSFDGKLWQRNYYEHVIRNAQAYENISDYIINNPARWRADRFHGD